MNNSSPGTESKFIFNIKICQNCWTNDLTLLSSHFPIRRGTTVDFRALLLFIIRLLLLKIGFSVSWPPLHHKQQGEKRCLRLELHDSDTLDTWLMILTSGFCVLADPLLMNNRNIVLVTRLNCTTTFLGGNYITALLLSWLLKHRTAKVTAALKVIWWVQVTIGIVHRLEAFHVHTSQTTE